MNADEFPVIESYFRWARSQYEEGHKTADAIAVDAIRRYGNSPAILESLIREVFRLFAHEAIAGRRPVTPAPIAETFASAVDNDGGHRDRMTARRKQAIIDKIRNADDPVTKFFERHPDHRVEVPLLSMTREQLLEAATYRDAESAQAQRRARLCREIADRLQPGQVAQEVFTEEEVETMARKITNHRITEIRRAG